MVKNGAGRCRRYIATSLVLAPVVEAASHAPRGGGRGGQEMGVGRGMLEKRRERREKGETGETGEKGEKGEMGQEGGTGQEGERAQRRMVPIRRSLFNL